MKSILFIKNTQIAVAPDEWHQLIVARGYRAVVFDCDGTLVDSSEAHFQALKYAVQSQGHDMDRDWYLARTGLDRVSALRAFAADLDGRLDVIRAVQDSIAAFILRADSIALIPETACLIRALGPAFPMAVGTNAEASVARASLQAAGLIGYFDLIASISDGLPPKPSPDIFAQAAMSLGFPTSQTLVFEDSIEGVNAARAANLDVIQLFRS